LEIGKYRITVPQERVPMHREDAARSRRPEQGIILVFLAVGLATLLLAFAAFAANLGLKSVIRAHLRNSVDSAAQAAVTALCSSRECYQTAREMALGSIAELLPAYLGERRGRAGPPETRP
jgi:hypothetical protein